MTDMTNYLETEFLDHVLNGNDAPSWATVYVALHTSATADDGTGTEVSGGSYARQAGGAFTITGEATRAYNATKISFPVATADWGVVTHVAFWSAISGGSMLLHGALAASRDVKNGDTFEFQINTLGVTFD